MKKIYISGKITGLPIEGASENFNRAEIYLKSKGYEVMNPMKEVPFNKSWSWGDYMRSAIILMMKCDSIYMLNTHEESKGALIELQLAKDLQMTRSYQENAL